MYKTEYRYWAEDNGIIYDSEINIPSMQELFKNVVYAHNPDHLYYFNANHLGSGSLITDKYGQTYQTLIYAPHGEVLFNKFYGDYDEPYKFTGYEKDNESGLNYAKARYYWSTGGFMNSTDPHCFNYPGISSYAFSFNNSVNVTDPTGMDPVYDLEGNHLGNTKEGFTGGVIVYGGEQRDFSNMSATDALKLDGASELQKADLSAKTYSNIYTNILQQSGYDTGKLEGGAISIDNGKNNSFNNPVKGKNALATTKTNSKSEIFNITVYQQEGDVKKTLTTVENIVNALGAHEYTGHGIKRYSDSKYNHQKAYEEQFNHSSWANTTSYFKAYMNRNYINIKISEDFAKKLSDDLKATINARTKRK